MPFSMMKHRQSMQSEDTRVQAQDCLFFLGHDSIPFHVPPFRFSLSYRSGCPPEQFLRSLRSFREKWCAHEREVEMIYNRQLAAGHQRWFVCKGPEWGKVRLYLGCAAVFLASFTRKLSDIWQTCAGFDQARLRGASSDRIETAWALEGSKEALIATLQILLP